MMQMLDGRNFIDGEWVPGEGEPWDRLAPSDEQPVWGGRWASVAQTQAAVSAARTPAARSLATQVGAKADRSKGSSPTSDAECRPACT